MTFLWFLSFFTMYCKIVLFTVTKSNAEHSHDPDSNPNLEVCSIFLYSLSNQSTQLLSKQCLEYRWNIGVHCK